MEGKIQELDLCGKNLKLLKDLSKVNCHEGTVLDHYCNTVCCIQLKYLRILDASCNSLTRIQGLSGNRVSWQVLC